MKILAIDSSAGPASCAIVEGEEILASSVVNVKLTHSQTLMPMIEGMLNHAALKLADIDVLAVSAGPGSFTGVRIGVSAVKGMAFPSNIPCAAVSTLAAMARNFQGLPWSGVICAVMDARCRQVYTALFSCEGGKIHRLTEDEAISIENLKVRLNSLNRSVIFVGDGAKLCYNILQGQVPDLTLAPPALRYQQAQGVAFEAAVMAEQDNLMNAAELQPVYLRLPQAERELKEKMETEKGKLVAKN